MIGKQDVQLVKSAKETEFGETLFETRKLWFLNEEGIPKVKNLSLSVKSGEILGIGGVEGNGQSELIRLLIEWPRFHSNELESAKTWAYCHLDLQSLNTTA